MPASIYAELLDSSLLVGSTDMTVTLYLPVGGLSSLLVHTPRGWPGESERSVDMMKQGGILSMECPEAARQ